MDRRHGDRRTGLGLFPVSPSGTITGALLCAGAALLADADHGSATVSRSVPVFGRLVTGGISRLSGGHRHGLHGVFAVLCTWLLATGLDQLSWQSPWAERPVDVGVAAASAAAIAFAAYALGLAQRSWSIAWMIGLVGAAGITVFAPERSDWFIVCITLGYGVHLAGDLLTTGGLPLLWPWVPKPPRAWRTVPILRHVWTSGGYVAVPVLGNAGSLREWALLIPVTLYVGYGMLFAALVEVGVDLATVMH